MRKYEEFAGTHLSPGSTFGDEWSVQCPIHGDRNPSASYNIQTGLFYCHACGAGGTTGWLAGELGVPWGDDTTETVDHVVAAMVARVRKLRTRKRRRPEPRTTMATPSVLERWATRGVSPETVRDWGLGWNAWDDALTIPVLSVTDEYLGDIRRYLGDTDRRYRYPRTMKVGHVLFGANRYDHGRGPLVLVEGSIDAILLWQSGVRAAAILGSSLTRHQVALIRGLGCADVTLAFDNDMAGRRATDRAAELLDGHVVSLSRFAYRSGDPKDPGDWLRDGRLDEYLERLVTRPARQVGRRRRSRVLR